MYMLVDKFIIFLSNTRKHARDEYQKALELRRVKKIGGRVFHEQNFHGASCTCSHP